MFLKVKWLTLIWEAVDAKDMRTTQVEEDVYRATRGRLTVETIGVGDGTSHLGQRSPASTAGKHGLDRLEESVFE